MIRGSNSAFLESQAPSEAEVLAFKTPAVRAGSFVRWYPHGYRDPQNERAAVVTKVKTRTLSLHVLSSGQRFDVVRHVDDPKLRLNEAHREDGAWEYTEEYAFREAEMAELRARVAELADQLAKVSSSQNRNGK